jgi:drug/metabolite transporter (DMT)-like permease
MTTASETALIYAAVPIWGILLGLALGLERRTPWVSWVSVSPSWVLQ